MGCNIHGLIEIKNDNWNYWRPCLREPLGDRWYRFFAYIANVRNTPLDIIPISKPRGDPEHTTKTYEFMKLDYHEDAHSHSWLSGKELLDTPHTHLNDIWIDWFKIVREILRQHGTDNVRFVFFFDN